MGDKRHGKNADLKSVITTVTRRNNDSNKKSKILKTIIILLIIKITIVVVIIQIIMVIMVILIRLRWYVCKLWYTTSERKRYSNTRNNKHLEQ